MAKVKIGNLKADSYYSVCTTAHNTAEKTVEIQNFFLAEGRKVSIIFRYMNTATAPTLQVNDTGAKPMYIGTEALKPMQIRAGKLYEFIYDGEYWQLLNPEHLAEFLTERSCLETTGMGNVKDALAVIRTAFLGGGYETAYSAIGLGDWLDIPEISAGSLGVLGNTSGNLRIRIAGFNTYDGVGDTDSGKGILWEFANGAFLHNMNDTATNADGYAASGLKALLNGDFLSGLTAAIGITPATVHRLIDTKDGWAWLAEQCFLPQETEVFGHQAWGKNLGFSTGSGAQWQIYAVTPQKRCKKYNGARYWWWEASRRTDITTGFCNVGSLGSAHYYSAAGVAAVSPALYIR